MVLIVDLIKY